MEYGAVEREAGSLPASPPTHARQTWDSRIRFCCAAASLAGLVIGLRSVFPNPTQSTPIGLARTKPVGSAGSSPSHLAFRNADYSKLAPSLDTSGDSWPTRSTYGTINITADVASEVAEVSEFYFGTNLPIYMLDSFVNKTIDYIAETNIRFVRWPGGTPANQYLWDCDYDRFPYFANTSWMCGSLKTSQDDFVNAVKFLGATPYVQLNAAICLVYSVEACAAYSLEQHEAFLASGVNVTYYEFGNENYGSWERPFGDAHHAVNGTLYGEAMAEVARVMKAKYDYLQIGAVVNEAIVATDPSVSTISNWSQDMLSTDAAVMADYLVIHQYFVVNNSSPSYDSLIGEVSLFRTMVENMQHLFESIHPGVPMPPMILNEYDLAETSSAACARTTQFFSSLWHAVALGETLLDTGSFSSLMAFAWGDKTVNCSYSKTPGVGDYGLFAKGDYHGFMTDGTPRAKYYTQVLAGNAIGSRMVETTTSSEAGASVKVYASTFDGGELGAMLVNTGAACRVNLAIESMVPSMMNGWILQSAQSDSADPMAATQVQWNSNGEPLSFPLSAHYSPYMLTANEGDGIFSFDVPAYSVVGLVVHVDTNSEPTTR